MAEKFLIVLAGPTGIGKTQVAIELALKLDTFIISCDSRQIYKELSIGTAVPSPVQLSRVKHYFIHNKSILDYYNASMYENEVLELLKEIYKSKDTIVMTGGTGLYIDAVCFGIDDLPTVDPDVRESLLKKYCSEGIEGLRIQLKTTDPDYYAKADLKNPKRILKALEISVMTGKPYSKFLTHSAKERPFSIVMMGLNMDDRKNLYEQINMRVDRMIEAGLVDEAKGLIGYKNLNSLNTVGYKEIFRFLDGEITLEEAIDLIKRNTRKYARRQLTWFRKYKDIRWFEPGELELIYDYVTEKIL